MAVDIPAVHSITCGRMYRRKAADDHLPRIMIFKTEVWARKSAIAAPERREWVPIPSVGTRTSLGHHLLCKRSEGVLWCLPRGCISVLVACWLTVVAGRTNN